MICEERLDRLEDVLAGALLVSAKLVVLALGCLERRLHGDEAGVEVVVHLSP